MAVTGSFSEAADFGGTRLTSAGLLDAFLLSVAPWGTPRPGLRARPERGGSAGADPVGYRADPVG